ncbi:MAG: aminodeoxychorismate synthase component I [Thermoguttaceae bacterium]|jgi:para-aminobenzoate synthetase component 1|nr:aminodeoxychorismate synthase component I [Thermoguttaceae bacterium]
MPGPAIVEELLPPPGVEEAFLRLAVRPHCLFLDSALREPRLGRYSFLAAAPFEYFERADDDADSLGELARRLARFETERLPELPPFQGGAAGLLAYDLGRQLERVPRPAFDEFQTPALAIGLYDVVLAWDHVEDRAWIISQGFPEVDPARRHRRARERLAEVQGWLKGPIPDSAPRRPSRPDVAAVELAPQYAVPGIPKLTSDFSEAGYLRAVERAIEYVYAGDIFQVNLAQRLLYPAADDPVRLYLRLRRRNPAPFAGFFDLGDFAIVSASPERFLRVRDRFVEARPIKGTRPRTARLDADQSAADELRRSEKDRAENVMIVDLLRNDLSRVCQADSVRVTQLCEIEQYAYVQHLVSAIRGRLRDEHGPIDLVRAAFPGGSITGAPKVRAMEIIAELEPTARGPYCGSMGYIGFDGSMDLSILIRTITAGRGWWQAPVGGGIVAQSDSRREYDETWHKAEGLLRALRE